VARLAEALGVDIADLLLEPDDLRAKIQKQGLGPIPISRKQVGGRGRRNRASPPQTPSD
jgi:hypothetical protein